MRAASGKPDAARGSAAKRSGRVVMKRESTTASPRAERARERGDRGVERAPAVRGEDVRRGAGARPPRPSGTGRRSNRAPEIQNVMASLTRRRTRTSSGTRCPGASAIDALRHHRLAHDGPGVARPRSRPGRRLASCSRWSVFALYSAQNTPAAGNPLDVDVPRPETRLAARPAPCGVAPVDPVGRAAHIDRRWTPRRSPRDRS